VIPHHVVQHQIGPPHYYVAEGGERDLRSWLRTQLLHAREFLLGQRGFGLWWVAERLGLAAGVLLWRVEGGVVVRRAMTGGA
jgi:hypothetical protein